MKENKNSDRLQLRTPHHWIMKIRYAVVALSVAPALQISCKADKKNQCFQPTKQVPSWRTIIWIYSSHPLNWTTAAGVFIHLPPGYSNTVSVCSQRDCREWIRAKCFEIQFQTWADETEKRNQVGPLTCSHSLLLRYTVSDNVKQINRWGRIKTKPFNHKKTRKNDVF